MNSILIDTNFYADIMRGTKEARILVQKNQKILLSPIVVGELLYGFKNGKNEKNNIVHFHTFLESSSVEVVNITEKTAEFFSMIIQQLRKSGTPIPTNDIWIAASAMEYGVALATNDQHFKKILNLLLVL